MKKVKSNTAEESRAEYRREDFGAMTRGRYAARLKASSNVVVLQPEVASAFPNSDAVNNALLGLIELARAAARARRRPAARAKARTR